MSTIPWGSWGKILLLNYSPGSFLPTFSLYFFNSIGWRRLYIASLEFPTSVETLNQFLSASQDRLLIVQTKKTRSCRHWGGVGICGFGHWVRSVLLSVAVCGFSFFGAKIKQVSFLYGSLCSQMLSYFICFYFTVNLGQTALWDSGFLMELYSFRATFLRTQNFPHCPLLLFNRGYLWILLEDTRADMPVLRPYHP